MIAAVRTPFTRAELCDALTVACIQQLGWAERATTKAIVCAQVALETGDGKSCVCHNPGNYRAGTGSPDTCEFLTTEWQGTPPAPVRQMGSFSAWPSLADGLGYHLDQLYTHWREAWDGAVAGDPMAFAAGLRTRGYYTAPLDQYAAGVKAWQAVYLPLFGPDPPAEEPPPLSPEMAAYLARGSLLDSPTPSS
jgi:hypothetical protein